MNKHSNPLGRLCIKCGVVLMVGDNWEISQAIKYHYICHSCRSIHMRRYNAKSNAKQHGMRFHPDVPAHICLEFQDNKCAICGIKSNGRILHRDHNHLTGWFRGYLCGPDNTKLVSAGVDESPENALQYFIKHDLDQDYLLKISDYLYDPPYFKLLELLYYPRPTGTWKQYMEHFDLEGGGIE